VDQKKDALKKGEDMDTKKKKLEDDREAKQREYNRTNKQVVRNHDEIKVVKDETDKYEATQKKLVSVEKRVQAAEKAATEAKKLLEQKKTSKAAIEAHFGLKPGDINDQEYIDAVNAVYPDQAATIANDIGRAQKQMESANELSLWKVLMRILAGAEIA